MQGVFIFHFSEVVFEKEKMPLGGQIIAKKLVEKKARMREFPANKIITYSRL